MSGPVRVVIADDHPMFRFGLRMALAGATEPEVVGEASNGAELAGLVERLRPGVVLTDVAMPAGDGLSAIRILAERFPDIAALVLTMHAEDETVIAALRAGARGYLLKDAEREEIVRAVLTVASGGTVYDGSVGRRISDFVSRPLRPGKAFAQLTDREHEVLEQVAAGRSNHEIAAVLQLSEKTVRNNVATVLAKLAARDRAALVARARDAFGSPIPSTFVPAESERSAPGGTASPHRIGDQAGAAQD
jgi:DNA-binding NarL/FixJ family response regulator